MSAFEVSKSNQVQINHENLPTSLLFCFLFVDPSPRTCCRQQTSRARLLLPSGAPKLSHFIFWCSLCQICEIAFDDPPSCAFLVARVVLRAGDTTVRRVEHQPPTASSLLDDTENWCRSNRAIERVMALFTARGTYQLFFPCRHHGSVIDTTTDPSH